MKPNTTTAMANLIQEARQKIPFHLSFNGNCVGECDRCPQKLLEFLDTELSAWEYRLKKGIVPNLGDVHTVGKNCTEVYTILQNNKMNGCKKIDPGKVDD